MNEHSNNNKLTEHMVLTKTRANSLSDITQLNMWGYNLIDVSLFRYMENVEVVSMPINDIRDLQPFANCTKLRQLLLRHNQINDFGQLQNLKNLQNLTTLGLSENPIADSPNYRSTVIQMLPQLKVLDGVEITEMERQNRVNQPAPVTSRQKTKEYIEEFDEYTIIRKKNVNHDAGTDNIRNREHEYEAKTAISSSSSSSGSLKITNDTPRRHRRRRSKENYTNNDKYEEQYKDRYVSRNPGFKGRKHHQNFKDDEGILTAVLSLLPELSTESLSIVINSARKISYQRD